MAAMNQLNLPAVQDLKNKKWSEPDCIVLDDIKWNNDKSELQPQDIVNAFMNCLINNRQDNRAKVLIKFLVSVLNCCRLECLEYEFFFSLITITNHNIRLNACKFPKEQYYFERELSRSWKIEFLRELVMENRLSKNGRIGELTTQNILIFLGPSVNKHINSFIVKKTEGLIPQIQELKKTTFALEQHIKEQDDLIKKQQIRYYKILEQNRSLENELIKLKEAYEKLNVEHEETLYDLGKLSVERAANINETKKAEIFESIFPSKESPPCIAVRTNGDYVTTSVSSDQAQHFPQRHSQEGSPGIPHVSNFSPSVDASVVTEDRCRPVQHLAYAVQDESGEQEPISLSTEPHSSITANVYYAYKLLLLTISHSLLFSEIAKMKIWANEHFSVETNLSATEIVYQLDRNGAINATDLSSLTTFFESILRYDLLLLIETFCSGDYEALKSMISMNNQRNRFRNRVRVANLSPVYSSRALPNNVGSNVNNSRELERTSTPNNHNVASNVNNEHNPENLGLNSTTRFNVRGNTTTSHGHHRNSEVLADGPTLNNGSDYDQGTSSYETPNTAAQRSRIEMCRSTTLSSKNNVQNHHSKCHGHSQSQSGDNFNSSKNDTDEDDKWLCDHYKRRCFVKFECCDTFWPCHRCHNSDSNCGRNKLKSRDTKMVKCVECGKEQQFGENGQFCVQCNTKFADFYCGQCKHLTGMDDFPYHCDKCGICRIHGDRSFHCNVCGVCLDVQLRGNHKCRPDSAHDECCICLEDAFTGCQILPCSHKVHKNCATRMIQSGITRCPICRESFAHKLERRPNSKKIIRKK